MEVTAGGSVTGSGGMVVPVNRTKREILTVTFIMVIHPAQGMPNAPTIPNTVIILVLALCSEAFKAFKNLLPSIHLHLGRVVDVDTCIAKGH